MIKLKNLLERKNKIKRIMLDMDGVLCDFDSQFKKYLANDVLFKSVVSNRKTISQKKLSDRGMTKEDFIRKAYEIRDKVLKSNPGDTFEAFKVMTREQLGVPLSWSYIMKSRETFWSTMDWMPGGKELVDFVSKLGANVEILTAGAGPYAKNGKQEWLSKNGMSKFPFNIVNKGSEKGMMAEEGTILIDDKKENIDIFSQSGGLGILYTDTPSAIKQLKSYK